MTYAEEQQPGEFLPGQLKWAGEDCKDENDPGSEEPMFDGQAAGAAWMNSEHGQDLMQYSMTPPQEIVGTWTDENGRTIQHVRYWYSILEEREDGLNCGMFIYRDCPNVSFDYLRITSGTGEVSDSQCIIDEEEFLTTDTDGDGILDINDPFPYDGTGFTWKIVSQQFDENGYATYTVYKACNDSGCIFITEGTNDPNKPTWITLNDPWKDPTDWPIHNNPGSQPIHQQPELDQEPIQTNGQDYEEGEEGDGSSTDNAALNAIQANTAKIAQNQETQGKQLEGLQQIGVEQINKLDEISGKLDNVGGTGGSTTIDVEMPTADEIGEAVNEAMSDTGGHTAGEMDTIASSSDGAYQGAIDAFNTPNNLETDAPEGYRTRRDIETGLGEIVGSQEVGDVKNIIESSGVECIGDCSMNFNYKGTTVPLSICAYQSAFNAWGVIIQGLAGLSAILIVFRRN